jgi:hypothetical protein
MAGFAAPTGGRFYALNDRWRKRQAFGDVIIVRYADDFVLGFQHKHEAERS